VLTSRRHTLQNRRGFTLVEILIVVSIIGILAAIVFPQFKGSTAAAKAANGLVELQTARKQLEIWRMDHGGNYPTLVQLQLGANDWSVFTSKTNSTGALDVSGTHGPYFAKPLTNIFTNSSNVVAAGAATAIDGWTYNASTGEIRVVIPNAIDLSKTKFTSSDYEQP
jgi:general secretion pathway protein G